MWIWLHTAYEIRKSTSCSLVEYIFCPFLFYSNIFCLLFFLIKNILQLICISLSSLISELFAEEVAIISSQTCLELKSETSPHVTQGSVVSSMENQTCQLCQGRTASHFCNCLHPPTLFCMECFPCHHAKHPGRTHHPLPIAVLGSSSLNVKQHEALGKAVTALRQNLERMEDFSHQFDDLIQKCIDYLTEYRDWWMQQLQTEKQQLAETIEAAVLETSICLDQGTEPASALAHALWTLPAKDLQVFKYSITPPDLQTLCQSWASSHNSLQDLCRKPKEGAKNLQEDRPQKKLNPTHLFASVYRNTLRLYDLQSQLSSQHSLSEDFGDGGSYIQMDRQSLLCLGAYPSSRKVYRLDLSSFQLTPLPPLLTPRGFAGVAKLASIVYIFGGLNGSEYLRVCEKYGLQDRQWQSLRDMRKEKGYFTPCTYRTLIYLPCPNITRNIETFDSETETFSYLSVHLPRGMRVSESAAFVANGELCILTLNKQMGRWKIESEGEFRLTATEMSCWSSQPPLVVGSLVLISIGYSGEVQQFSLDTYTFI